MKRAGVSSVSYHRDAGVLQPFDDATTAPFQRAEWFSLLAEGKNNAVFVQAELGDARAAMALWQHGKRLEALTNWYSFSWTPLIANDSGCAALVALCKALHSRAASVHLSPLPDEDGTASRLEGAMQSAGWIVFRQACDTNHFLRIEGRSSAECLAATPGRLRTTLKRKAKKVRCQIITEFSDDSWTSYEQVYAASWKPEEGDASLLRAFAEAEGKAGRLRLGIAYDCDQAVAAQFWTVDNGTAYIHKLAYRENAKPLSPGSSLTAALMQHVIDVDGVQFVDFGTGDDGYKADWMNDARPRYRLDCYRLSEPRNWPRIARAAVRQLASKRGSG